MLLMDYLPVTPVTWVILSALLGLLVGSFLNVVIYRLPVMLQREWQQQCLALNGQTAEIHDQLSLCKPRSRCPHCDHVISAMENIPLVSYLFLQGKCRHCKADISIRYPLIELLTGVLSAVIAYQFGPGWPAVGALLLTWALVALTFIDLDHQLLPDNIVLPLIWLGLLFNLFSTYTDINSSVIGVMAGYLSLWLVFHLFRLLTGKEGMGYGDFKLLAALGAWLGWQFLPMIILLSSLAGSVIGISLLLLKKHQRDIPIPFGPYLAIAGWLALVFGPAINLFYLHLSGLD